MKKADWPVVQEDCRTNTDGMCFYCPSHLGEQHADGCVIRRRTVVVRLTFEMVRLVPEHWGAHDVEFHGNGSSFCADNLLDELDKVLGSEPDENGTTCGRCMCGRTKIDFVREATPQDEETLGVPGEE